LDSVDVVLYVSTSNERGADRQIGVRLVGRRLVMQRLGGW